MEKYNIWETNFKEDYIYFDNIEVFFEHIEKENTQYNIEIKDEYNPKEEPSSSLELKAQKENVIINYTNEKHQFVIQKENFIFARQLIISQATYEKNKSKIIEQFRKIKEKQIKQNDYITIDGFYFSNELLDKAIENKRTINLKDVKLTEKQLNKIKNSFLDIYLDKKTISKKNPINGYSKERLEKEDKIIINSDIKDEELTYIPFIKKEATIEISNDSENIDDYYKQVFKILEELKKNNKTGKVKFEIEKRIGFEKYIPLLEKYQNIEIDLDSQEYSINEYIEENNKLEKLVKNIKTSNMSPLEKYMAVYNIVKKFKPYKENNENKNESRQIKYILNNDYIVCVGYSNLLIELLSRVGIEATEYSTTVKNKNEEGNLENGAHARTIVNLKDEKYDINGYFIADPTWDSHGTKYDTYDYALRPFKSMQKTIELFNLEEIDYILDNNDFNSFCKKVNILLNKKIKEKNDILEAYNYIFYEIKELLKQLDSQEYNELKKYIEIDAYERTEKFYEEFLTEVGHYIVAKSNKEINPEIIAKSASIAKFYNEDIPDAFKQAYKDKLIKEYSDYTYEIQTEDINNQDLKENEGKGWHI